METIEQILIHVSNKKQYNKSVFCALCFRERYSRKEIAIYLSVTQQNIYYYMNRYGNSENDTYQKCVEILNDLETKKQDYVKELINSKRTNN